MGGLTSFAQFVASPFMPVMVSTCLIGIACVLSTCWIPARLRKHRRHTAMDTALDLAQRVAAMQLALDAQEDVLEHNPLAIAVFDCNQKLVSRNRAYSDLWGLPRAWLDTRLSYGEILERLRDERKLPERRNFSDWKLAHTSAISRLKGKVEESWHLPGGKSVRITAWPHLQGGFFLQVEDITERLHWQAEFNLLAQVQKATLDTLSDGIAIFGTDGRLVLYNERFAAIWKLSSSDLEQQPHFTRIANLCSARIGRDAVWDIVSCGINSGAPETLGAWGKTERADGRTISLTLSRLPNGSTVANFSDLTDLERFDGIRNDRSRAKFGFQGGNGFSGGAL